MVGEPERLRDKLKTIIQLMRNLFNWTFITKNKETYKYLFKKDTSNQTGKKYIGTTSDLYYKTFRIVIYDHNDSTITLQL